MRMPEPEEDKVTATGGGMRASGLLKLGAVRRSLSLEERSVYTTVRFNRKFSRSMLLCVCAFFDRATRLSRLRLRAASNRAQETSELSTCLCARPHCACVCLVYNTVARALSGVSYAHICVGTLPRCGHPRPRSIKPFLPPFLS